MLHPIVQYYCEEDVVDIRGFDRTELVEAEEGRFVVRAYPGPDCGNNIGTVHGGFLLALADIVGTGSVDTLGYENSTMSMTTNFLKPAHVDDEYLEVTGTVLKRGKHVVVSEVEIRRPNDELAMKATITCYVFDSKIEDLPRLQHLR